MDKAGKPGRISALHQAGRSAPHRPRSAVLQATGPGRGFGTEHLGIAPGNKALFGLFRDASAVHTAPGIEIGFGHQQPQHPFGEPFCGFNRHAAAHAVTI